MGGWGNEFLKLFVRPHFKEMRAQELKAGGSGWEATAAKRRFFERAAVVVARANAAMIATAIRLGMGRAVGEAGARERSRLCGPARVPSVRLCRSVRSARLAPAVCPLCCWPLCPLCVVCVCVPLKFRLVQNMGKGDGAPSP